MHSQFLSEIPLHAAVPNLFRFPHPQRLSPLALHSCSRPVQLTTSMRASLLAAVAAAAAGQSYVTLPWPVPSASSLNTTLGYGTVTSTGTRFNWYVASLDDLSRFSLALPANGCAVLQRTTATAIASGCVLGTNSGYFQFSPKPTYCLGELIINGSVANWANDGSPIVGVTRDSSVLGVMSLANATAAGVVHAVSGFGVVVLDGAPHADGIQRARRMIKALRPNAEEIAPRTAVAFDAQNRMLLVVIDGVEALNLGVTLTELAEIMTGGASGFPFLATHAINLDGGGSSTMSASPLWPLLPAQVFNRPTDTDTGPVTERAVTSIICVKP